MYFNLFALFQQHFQRDQCNVPAGLDVPALWPSVGVQIDAGVAPTVDPAGPSADAHSANLQGEQKSMNI
jgi:hypothetical protein